jgi:hypothetical protein
MPGGSGQHRGRAGRKRLVAAWPSYLLVNVPELERRSLSGEAAAREMSVGDVVRDILCAKYDLSCPPKSKSHRKWQDKGSPNLLVRMPPKLALSLEADARNSGQSKRQIILDAIGAHYTKGAQ